MVAFALLFGLAALLWFTRWGSTPPLRAADGKPIAGSIAMMQRLPLGGVPQSVLIRGRSADAPILIWLHGGPGMDATGMWRRNNAVLEEHFLVVYWVQRGTGRSWSRDIPPESMRLSRFVADLDELIERLRQRFGQDRRIVLVGHSWGTSVGIAYARAHPEKLAAYVGISQVVDAVEGERRAYAFTLAEAQRRGDQEALADLQAIGPPPHTLEALQRQRKWLDLYGGQWREPRSMASLIWESFGASEMTWFDGVTYPLGQDFSSVHLQGDIARVNWMRDAPQLGMPVFILAGRFDHNTDAGLQREYLDRLQAPAKRFVLFERSAHSPPFEEPAAFNSFMINAVLPVASGLTQDRAG